jgi:putative FmdB family regulatory protein
LPLYQYQCSTCQHDLEVFQKMNARPMRTCPKCERRTLARIIGSPAIRTSADFTRGRGTLLSQFGGDEAEVNRLVNEAKKQGYTPRDTDVYDPTAARCKGDPAAFFPASDPMSGVKRACANLGVGCKSHGIEIKAPEQRDPPRKRAVAVAL